MARCNYLRWTPPQLADYADVPIWLVEGLESGQIQDTDSSNKRKIVRAIEIAYQGPAARGQFVISGWHPVFPVSTSH